MMSSDEKMMRVVGGKEREVRLKIDGKKER